ncbi:hypothetical protein L195_g041402 [Trifolium pratense]|uniref:Uncharacterized protein n=1 Tax=Trifolium pratense TaxID=57577 RepID=A0A2K3M3J1_TRIPR|nr:hypothetical protein L195_g041402 [Trifolium pratense]
MSSITGLCTGGEVVSSFVTSDGPIEAYVPGVTAMLSSIKHLPKTPGSVDSLSIFSTKGNNCPYISTSSPTFIIP